MIIDKRTLAKFGYREKCFFLFGFLGNPILYIYSGDTQELPFLHHIKNCKT
jgi:hypothetical protein